MPVAFQAAGAPVESTSGNVTPAWPTHLAGDIGLLLVESGGWWAQLLTLSGWQRVPGAPQKAGLETQTSNVYLDVWWKRAASGAEAGPTIVFVRDRLRAMIVTFRGAPSTNRPFTASEGGSASASTTLNTPGVTTVDSGQLVVSIVANSTFSNSAQLSGWANGDLTGLTEVVDTNSAVGDGSGFSVVVGTRATPGIVGGTNASLATSSAVAMLTIAFTPQTQPTDKKPWIAKIGTPVERATAGTIAPAWPEHAAGDIGILVIESGAWPVTVPTPSGFTQLAISPVTAGVSNTSPATSQAVYWKRATGGAEAAPIIDFNADHVRAFIFTVKNAKASGDPFDAADFLVTTAATTSMNYPSVTTNSPDELVILLGSHSIDSTSPDHLATPTNANLESVAEVFQRASSIGNGSGIIISSGIKKTAGATGVSASASDTSTHHTALTLTLQPSAVENVTVLDPAILNFTGQTLYHKVDYVTALAHASVTITGQVIGEAITTKYVDQLEPATLEFIPQELGIRKWFGMWERKEVAAPAVWTKQLPLEN